MLLNIKKLGSEAMWGGLFVDHLAFFFFCPLGAELHREEMKGAWVEASLQSQSRLTSMEDLLVILKGCPMNVSSVASQNSFTCSSQASP